MDGRFAGVDWLFFDIGYTLFDETPAVLARAEAAVGVLAGVGIVMSVGDILAAHAEGSRRHRPSPFVDGLVDLMGGRFDAAWVRRHLPYDAGLDTPYDGAAEVLAALAARYRLGIIANQLPGSAGRLAAHGLRDHFDVVVASAEAGVAKPDPAIFRLALYEAGCAPAAAVMIGDRIDNDVRPARALGLRTIRVRQGVAVNHAPRTPADTPDATVDDLRGLLALL